MNYEAHCPKQPQPRRGFLKNMRQPRRLAAVPRRPIQPIVGASAIAAYMFSDPQMAGVVRGLTASGKLGHHYRAGVLCSTRTACRLCLMRLVGLVEEDQHD